ncbi:MAG: response regulator [Rhodobiaceae bacterium]|nr:response regulator [Rhodobiaceae bacterium]
MTETSLAPLRILIVEDSEQMRTLLQALLEAMSITDILIAGDGEQGLALYMESAPDIVITDGAMVPMDGYELTNRIRTAPDNPNPYVPILMLSGHQEKEHVEKARASGVTEYLAKPVSWQTLYERLVAIVSNPSFFVRTPTYLGPDRRRETHELYQAPSQHNEAQPPKTTAEILPLDAIRRPSLIRTK